MIEDPPLLIIKEQRPAPTEQQLAALKDTPTGFLVDAMNGRGALPTAIRHVSPGILPVGLCGPALTCLCGPADVLAVFAAMSEIRKGDVLVAATGGWTGCAVIGDRVMGMLRNAGGQGFITDGLVRDVAGINAVGLPVMSAGVSPNSPFASGPGEIGKPVQLGGVVINSGDIIVSDADGAVVVPLSEVDAVIEALAHVRQLETSLDAEVADGLYLLESVKALLNSNRVKRI